MGERRRAELARPFASPETGSTGQPQERQHSAAEGGTRDRLPPARGAISARGIVTGRPRRQSRCGISTAAR